jgi:hypothetical protein
MLGMVSDCFNHIYYPSSLSEFSALPPSGPASPTMFGRQGRLQRSGCYSTSFLRLSTWIDARSRGTRGTLGTLGALGAVVGTVGLRQLEAVNGISPSWRILQKAYGYGSIPIDTFLVGWTSICQLFWGSLGTRVLTHPLINHFSQW